MSQFDIDVDVRFKSSATKEIFVGLLSAYTQAAQKKSKTEKKTQSLALLERLQSIGIDGRSFLFGDGDAAISEMQEIGKNCIRFHLLGGTLGGSIFWDELYHVLLQSNPREIVAVEYNDQIGEFALHVFDGKNQQTYPQGNAKWDRILNAAFADDGAIADVMKNLLSVAKESFVTKTPRMKKAEIQQVNKAAKASFKPEARAKDCQRIPSRARQASLGPKSKKIHTGNSGATGNKSENKRGKKEGEKPIQSMLEGEYRKHQGAIYWDGMKVETANAETFEPLNHLWGKDKRAIFFKGHSADVDRRSFRVLNACFAKDKNQVWCTEGVVQDVDAKSFEVLDDGRFVDPVDSCEYACGYARDKRHVYFYHMDFDKPHAVRGATIKSFQTINYFYGRDGVQVFRGTEQIKLSDPESFEILAGNFSRDANRVYYGAKVVKAADPSTFRVLKSEERRPSFCFAADAAHVYYGDVLDGCILLDDADPATFRVLDRYCGTDGSRHYLSGKRIRRLPEKYR